ncbi:MAG: FG-GAP repeat protein [Planctomycetes bacterium]|nr:FG-GAP repeat protein [Planctomycetota bacterium]
MLARASRTACALALLAAAASAQLQAQKLVAADPGASDWFGFATDLDGTRALVGAVWDSNAGALDGSAYVFAFDGTSWTQEQKLTASDAGADDMLGITVSLEGEWALCGSYRDDDLFANSGSAYLFRRAGNAWTEVQKLKASDAAADDRFGWGTALSGTRLVVGAYQDDDKGFNSGSAYVFEWNGASWVETAKLTASDGAAGDAFGRDVALDGDVLVAGALNADAPDQNSGAAYVFEWDGVAWVETAKLVAPDGGAGDLFGLDVYVQGTRVLVGADGHDGAALDTGAAWLFEKQGGAWVATAELEAPDAASGDRLGVSVALDGDRAVCGAWRDDDAGMSSGAAYVFEELGGAWTFAAKLTAADPGAGDEFGYAVSIEGATVLVGSRWDDDGAENAGSVYVFDVPAGAVPYGFCGAGAPCGNADGTAGCATSAGGGASLRARGTTSVAADDLVLELHGVAPGQFGIVYMGAGQIAAPFGDGLRVVGAGGVGTFRFPPHAANAAGVIAQGPGLAQWAAGHFGVAGQVLAGSAWNLQGWFRDPAGPCGGGFNLSQGLAVSFTP